MARDALLHGARACGARVTEALTNVQQGHVPDEVFEEVKRAFSDEEIANLTLAVNQINAWNRISIAFRVFRGVISRRSVRKRCRRKTGVS